MQGTATILHEPGDDDVWRDLYLRIAMRYVPEDGARAYVTGTDDQPRALIGVRLDDARVSTWRMPVDEEDGTGIWARRYYLDGTKMSPSWPTVTGVGGEHVDLLLQLVGGVVAPVGPVRGDRVVAVGDLVGDDRGEIGGGQRAALCWTSSPWTSSGAASIGGASALATAAISVRMARTAGWSRRRIAAVRSARSRAVKSSAAVTGRHRTAALSARLPGLRQTATASAASNSRTRGMTWVPDASPRSAPMRSRMRLEVRPELLAGLLVGRGDVPGRVHADRQLGRAELGRAPGGRDRRTARSAAGRRR